jgi:hypothetical protein
VFGLILGRMVGRLGWLLISVRSSGGQLGERPAHRRRPPPRGTFKNRLTAEAGGNVGLVAAPSYRTSAIAALKCQYPGSGRLRAVVSREHIRSPGLSSGAKSIRATMQITDAAIHTDAIAMMARGWARSAQCDEGHTHTCCCHRVAPNIADYRWLRFVCAKRARMSQPGVARFEAGGTNPALPLLERLAEAFG